MKLAKVTGTVVASAKVDSLFGEKILVIQPIDENGKDAGLPIAAVDVARAGVGDFVFFESGREAANALANSYNPADACVLGIVDKTGVEQ